MRNFRLFGALALCAAMVPALTSCGDDDDDKGGDGTGGVLVIEGERISSISGVQFDYDSKGRLTHLSDNSGGLTIDYSRGKIYLDGQEDGENSYKIKFNGNGCITELHNSWSYTESEGGHKYQYKGSGTVTFSYNGSGYLVKCSSKSTETGKDLTSGVSGKYTESYTTNLTWRDGDLVNAVEKGTEIEGNDKDTWRDETEIDYTSTVNKFRQLPMAVSSVLNDDAVWDMIAAAGLFGKGTKHFPSSLCETDEEGYSNTISCSYRLNSVGAISSETISYNTYNYSYEEVSRGQEASGIVKLPDPRGFFMKRASRK